MSTQLAVVPTEEQKPPEANKPADDRFKVEVSIDTLRQRKLFIATPMYGAKCDGLYMRSMMDLSAQCSQMGIQLKVFTLFNESLITRARAYCVDEFLRSDSTHFMFIDSDIGFQAQDVIALLAIQSEDSPYDVIGGAYPKKCIAWEKIKSAVNKGMADENPNMLENFVGDYVFNPKVDKATGTISIRLDHPAEVFELGTGFMMVKRSVFDKFKETYPEFAFKPDHVRSEHFDGSRQVHMYFDTVIDPETKRYLSEDYMFCQYVQRMGGKIWLCPWMHLQHVGSYTFGGSLMALAAIQANPTADIAAIKKT